MPFLSYQACTADAIRNAGRLLQAGAEAVKLEGGRNAADTIRAIAAADIPVMGHIGLTPQSVHRMGGYRVQGKTDPQRERLLDDAAAVQEAGAFSVVLEGIPAALAGEITRTLSIPTIGIGAGVGCDGQVLVMQDLLGLFDEFRPKFVKRFGELRKPVEDAVGAYAAAVKQGAFPDEEHSFHSRHLRLVCPPPTRSAPPMRRSSARSPDGGRGGAPPRSPAPGSVACPRPAMAGGASPSCRPWLPARRAPFALRERGGARAPTAWRWRASS